MRELTVVIVGAGPSGLATAACLNVAGVPNIVIEKEDCCASLWKHRTYDRLKLHLAKEFCSLPHMPHPAAAPTYIPKDDFVHYLDNYALHFNVDIVYRTEAEQASFDNVSATWRIVAQNKATGTVEEYAARYLVIASGENSVPHIPVIPGLESFDGDVVHSSIYKSGKDYDGKRVLVIGCGNSGMEIAYDLCNFGAKTYIAIRSPFHVMTKEMIHLGMVLAKYFPVNVVDYILVKQSSLIYGDLSGYGIIRPKLGPLTLKAVTGRSPVIDVGTVAKIKSGEIQVVKAPQSIYGNKIAFSDGETFEFDAIVFATGYKSMANAWLQDEHGLLNSEGYPMKRFPNHWKGQNGLYCAGLSRRGLAGVSMDAQNIANDINIDCHGHQDLTNFCSSIGALLASMCGVRTTNAEKDN